ncbi:MAG: hypothetical protein ACI89X_004941 [Planctomycetota bacterium]|jgi:hypothetical protein
MNLADLRSRLSRSEKKGDLEKLLNQTDDELPWHDLIWMLQFPAFLGAGILVAYMASAANPEDTGPPVGQMLALAILVLCGTAMHFLHPFFRNRVQKLQRRLRKKGLVVPVALVQANSMWGQVDEWLYGSVLVSLDPDGVTQPNLLVAAAENVFALKSADRSTLPKDQRETAWNLYNELAPVRAVKVPESLTPGLSKCLLASVLLPPEALCEGSLLFALALPNDLDPNAIAILPEATLKE